MQRIQCQTCHKPIGFLDVFKAGLPNKIHCGACGARVNLKFNAYILYPIFIVLFVLFPITGFYVGLWIEETNIFSIGKHKIKIGVTLLFIIILEVIISLWLIYFLKVKTQRSKPYVSKDSSFVSTKSSSRSSSTSDISSVNEGAYAEAIKSSPDIAPANSEAYSQAFETICKDAEKLKLIVQFKQISTVVKEKGSSAVYNFVHTEMGNDLSHYFVDIEENNIDIYYELFTGLLKTNGLLSEMDWKLEADATEMLFALDRLYRAQNITPVTPLERQSLIEEVGKLEDGIQSAPDLVLARMETITNNRNKRLLWLYANTDSVMFIAVSEGCRSKLKNVKLGKEVNFY